MSADVAVYELGLRELADRIGRREVSPVEVTDAFVRRIEAIDPELNAFITVDGDRALAAADASERAIAAGYRLGPLHGVPIALKDNIATAGLRTTHGSHIRRNEVPESDATAWERLRSAGAILLGKLNMHEFAYGVTTNNPHHGPARNPWDAERTPGGSSGGSGAAVAARLCAGALGTDTGCSVRLPAAFNGITGLRPSIGRVSNHGVGALAWTLDTVGPMCVTAEDCALMLGALAGHDVHDPQTAPVAVPDYVGELDGRLRHLRLGLLEGALTSLESGVASAMEAALTTLREAGADVRDVRIPDLELATSALLTVDIAEPAALHAEQLRTRGADYGDDVRGLLEAGELYLATHYIQAQRYRTVVRDRFTAALRDVDALITPAVPFTAPPVEATQVVLQTGETLDIIPAVMRFQALAPLAGLPALSVPCGLAGDLPVGMQLIGGPFDEATLLRVAHGYQRATDWHRRRPSGIEHRPQEQGDHEPAPDDAPTTT